MIAALFVEKGGVYDLPGVDCWHEERDARLYDGPWPIVAHSPCQRWGRFWGGSTRKPHQFEMGDDKGCFKSMFANLNRVGGVAEHPAHSHAWDKEFFDIRKPGMGAGWQWDSKHQVWVCYVEQGHYGHMSRKPTWLIVSHVETSDLPELIWTRAEQRLHPVALERYGYEKARRIGMAAMVGGKDKTKIRERTPEPFRDVLLSIARSVK